MKVNLEETKFRLKKTGRTPTAFAYAEGVNPQSMRAFLNGNLPPSKGPVYKKIIDSLKRDGLLVVEGENT